MVVQAIDVDSREALLRRLRRIEGQVRGIERMIANERDCVEVITQLTAVQAALDKVALGLLGAHARGCLSRGSGADADLSDELMAAVARLMRRG